MPKVAAFSLLLIVLILMDGFAAMIVPRRASRRIRFTRACYHFSWLDRSQHDNQSWLAALATILDTSAIVMTQVRNTVNYSAKLAFAMARHAIVDLAQHYKARLQSEAPDRLDALALITFRSELQNAGWELRTGGEATLTELRAFYEPFLVTLGRLFTLDIPPIVSRRTPVDNWQTSAWMRRACGLKVVAAPVPRDDHEDP